MCACPSSRFLSSEIRPDCLIQAFNGFKESDPPQKPKASLLDFLLAFDALLNAHRTAPRQWAENSTTFIPVAPTAMGGSGGRLGGDFGDGTLAVAGVHGGISIVDGAHRLAASAVFGRPVLTVRMGGGAARAKSGTQADTAESDTQADTAVAARYDASFFRARGLSTPYLDPMAVEWLKLHGDAGACRRVRARVCECA